MWSPNTQTVQVSIKKSLILPRIRKVSYQESRRSLNEKGLSADVTVTQMLEIPEKDFKAAIVKRLQRAIPNT